MASVKDLTFFGIDLKEARHISIDDYDALVKQGCKPEVGDVLVAKDGNSALDTVCVVKKPIDTVLLSSVAILRPDTQKILPDLLKYYFRSTQIIQYLKSNFISGAAIPRVVLKDFKRAKITLPELPEQERIVEILNSLDDKIELNQRMNETLEAMARALFKSWFVDFDPVRAKAEGRRPEGMDATTAALFPAAFNDDGLPEGWEQTTLEKVADLNSESWGNANHPDDVEYVDLANTKWGTIESTQNFSRDDAPSRARRVLRPGDTIVGTVRPGNGSFSFIGSDGLTGSTGFAVLRPKKEIYREVVCYAATSKDNIDRLAHLADGGAYPAVRPDVVLSTPFIFPGDKILAAYSQGTAALLDRAEMNKQENKTLAEMRDALLLKLISGELRIGDAKGKRGK
jgi:type I restriction enzyme S subunit